jgi:hypothetical protein
VSFAQKTIGNDSRKTNMGKVATGLSMSLDGFIAGPNDGPRSPLGDGGTMPTGKRLQSGPGIPTLWGKPACIHEGKLTR